MRAHTYVHGQADSNKSANASCLVDQYPVVSIDWMTPSDGERYRFIREIELGGLVLVRNGDNRLRSAVTHASSRSPREYKVSKVSGGMLVERVS